MFLSPHPYDEPTFFFLGIYHHNLLGNLRLPKIELRPSRNGRFLLKNIFNWHVCRLRSSWELTALSWHVCRLRKKNAALIDKDVLGHNVFLYPQLTRHVLTIPRYREHVECPWESSTPVRRRRTDVLLLGNLPPQSSWESTKNRTTTNTRMVSRTTTNTQWFHVVQKCF